MRTPEEMSLEVLGQCDIDPASYEIDQMADLIRGRDAEVRAEADEHREAADHLANERDMWQARYESLRADIEAGWWRESALARDDERVGPSGNAWTWTIREVGEYLSVEPSTVTSYLARQQMPEPDGRLGRTPWWWADTIRAWRPRE